MTPELHYRENARLPMLKAEHDTAKATLEELASQDEISFHENYMLDNALTTMGFERIEVKCWSPSKRLYMDDFHPIGSTIDYKVLYARRGNETTEILSEDPLGQSVKRLSLYQIPVEQDIQEWYDSIPQRVKEYNAKVGKGISIGAISSVLAGTGVVIASGFLIGNNFIFGLFTGALGAATSYITFRVAKNKIAEYPFHKELIAEDQKALRYIANIPFEEMVEYNQPLRIEDVSNLHSRIEESYEESYEEMEKMAVAEVVMEAEVMRR
ncbi:MAG: hypothetical protein KJ771_07320 [Nanoarchaeota archaeon]|nr:hypothetical protein [Nanoarchaeota archaeon]